MPETPDEWNVLSMINWGTGYFEEKKVPSPRLSIEWILADILKLKRLNLYLQFERPLSGNELEQIREYVKRRARHEPLQYIIGHTDFMNTKIRVNPHVLIPRPETEQLVEIILEKHPDEQALNVLDIGTGSGCIAIALKQERPDWNVYGIDISEKAIATAEDNARLNHMDIAFQVADISKPETVSVAGNALFDVIVSNPPYIYPREKDSLDKEVRDYEPEQALFHTDPKIIYQQIMSYSEQHLKPGGYLYFELHEDWGQEILDLFNSDFWDASLLTDFNKKNRFLRGKFYSK